ncbi:uncharacterized protein FIBRA_07431 [Fibroporia radiculosa]|uniref:Uncharacterized protein n=1 Tax=Fibroporia radiculosa TaxID=599839 RepID=J4IBT5_9APHY|nr:uncharacterized protein FIBRA_07431 [Fibroporia radiculosa]CCM05221.1 predicted protein [Fibroporia radiculosa]
MSASPRWMLRLGHIPWRCNKGCDKPNLNPAVPDEETEPSVPASQ